MEMYERITGWVRLNRFDRIAAVVGLVLALALFPLRFVATQIYIETLPIVLGVACVLYLLADRREDDARLPTFPRGISRLLTAVVFAGTATLAVLAIQTGHRTPAFYAVAAATATVLLLQVFFTPTHELSARVVLFEALFFGLVVRFVGLTSTSGYIGIDVWTHVVFVEMMLEAGSLEPISHRKYYAAPLFHLLVMSGVLLFDSSIWLALVVLGGLVTLLPVVLVYSLSRLALVERWALAAAVIYSIGDHFLRWGLHIIPTNLGLVFFCSFLLFFGRVVHTQSRPRDYLFLVFFSVAIVLTHQISTFVLFVVLLSGIAARALLRLEPVFHREDSLERILSIPDPPKQTGLFLFNLGLITFTWSLTPHRGDTFLETISSFFIETLFTSAGFLNLAGGGGDDVSGGAEDQAPQALVELVTYIDTLGFLVLLFLGVVGCLYAIRGERATHLTLTFVVSVSVMLVFILGLPLFGIRNFVPGRWFAFLYVPLVILGLVGVRYLSLRLPTAATTVGVVVVIVLLPAVMLVASPAVADSPTFEEVQTRYGYTDAELAALEATDRYLHDDEVVYTDHPYQSAIERSGSQPADPATIPSNGTIEHDLVLYRVQQADGGVYFRDENGGEYRRSLERETFCDPSMDLVYDNADTQLCRR